MPFMCYIRCNFALNMNIIEYISRIGKSRGFGIQSPWAYSFVTEVIGERLPYYAYADIDRRCSTRRQRKQQRLYHRIRNFVYPHHVHVLDISVDSDSVIRTLFQVASPHDAVILENIYDDDDTRRRWHQLQQWPEVGVTFDLYDIAICFLDRDIYKQHYKLNFF